MDNEKSLPADFVTPHPYPPTNTNEQTYTNYQPPAYADDPPPYTCVTETHAYHYSYTEGSPAQQGTAYPHSLPPAPPSLNPAPMPYPNTNQFPSQGPTPLSYPGTAPIPVPSSSPVSPQQALLQPGPGKVVETTATGRRKKQSIVTDLESGKQYVVNERSSRNGRRHKTVIREMGGPTTVVKETPFKTVVKQKHG